MYPKKSRRGAKSGPKLRTKDHPEIGKDFYENPSLEEGIQDLKRLIKNINKQTDVIIDGYHTEESDSPYESEISSENDFEHRHKNRRNPQKSSESSYLLERANCHISKLESENKNLK